MNYLILAQAMALGAIVFWVFQTLIAFIQVTAWAFKVTTNPVKSITNRITYLSISVIIYWYLTHI